MRLSLPLIVLVLVAAGCVTAEGAYKRGMALEQAGRTEEAVQAYVDALERDAGLANVRGRLEVAGREAVAARLAEASAAGSARAAADALFAAARVVKASASVGVDVERPASFEADLAAAGAAAIEEWIGEADARLDAADYASAVRALDAARQYGPDPGRQADLDARALDAYLAWAEAEAAAGRFRAAFGQTETALALAPRGSAAERTLLGLRDRILDAGTAVVAVFPAEPASARTDLPRGFLRDFDDVLNDDALSVPMPFLAFVPPSDVRRLLRVQRDTDDRAENLRLLSSLAQDLLADFGVAVEVGPLTEEMTERDRKTASARLRRGGTARITRVRKQLEARLRARAVVAHADRRAEVCDDEVERRAVERFEVGEYDGDVDALRDRSDRDLFDPDREDEARDRALFQLRNDLVDALASRITGCLARQIP